MADIITFDVAEFEVLETFQYEEEVQRPENLRFFTLEEQLLDYFEARMPPGKPTRFQLQKLEKEQDRVKDAYLASVEDVAEGYAVKKTRNVRMPSWVHPLADDFTTIGYDYIGSYAPLFSEQQRSAAGFYNRLLISLPKPYRTASTENPLIDGRTVARIDSGRDVSALGTFDMTRTRLHEDGSLEIVGVPVDNTADDIRIKGYSMDARELALPNPLAGHPFLESVEAGQVITKEKFAEVYPSVDAILTHAVPTTQYPFTEGMKYLKVYDVRLNEIPWSVWKQRFPPVDPILEPPPPVTVNFPGPPDTQAPHETLQKMYGSPWKTGIHPRHWMSKQEDAGTMVARMLLAQSNQAGLVNVKPIGELLSPQYPTSDPLECLRTETFDEFVNSGVYRGDKCVPVGAIHEEQASLVSNGRKPWKETTEDEIVRGHQAFLRSYRYIPESINLPKYDVTHNREGSELRQDMLLILKDPERTEEDKVNAIETLLKDILPANNVFLDANGGFVLCAHTLAILKGDMAKNLDLFYRDWTTSDQGFRVCNSCGDQIGQVYTTQDEFDADGRLIVSQAALTEDSFHGQSQIDSFANSLKKLQHVFELKSALDSVFYLVLSLLQILPEERQLIPVLHVVRRMSLAFKAISTAKKFSDEVRNKVDGTLGFVGAVVLIQTHSPFLIPRRSFGSRPLVLSGFPRDTEDTKTKGILDTLLFIVKGMFEAFPGSFSGPIVPFVRSVVGKPGSVKGDAEKYLKNIATKEYAAQFEEARTRYNSAPPEHVALSTKTLPLMVFEKTEYAPSETLVQQPINPICNSVQPTSILQPKLGPNVSQAPIVLSENIPPSAHASYVSKSGEQGVSLQKIKDKDIRANLQLKFPALKVPSLQTFINESEDGIALTTLLQRLMDILQPSKNGELKQLIVTLDTTIDASLLRDTVRGLIFRFLHSVAKGVDTERKLQLAVRKDVVLRMILLKRDEAEKMQQTLRAKERETFKQRMRQMPDQEREVTKQLLDIGLAGYIITNEDRRMFAREQEVLDQDKETMDRVNGMDENMPPEGHNGTRDVEDGEAPIGESGRVLETDYGDYGDRADREQGDYGDDRRYDFGEGDGV